MADCNYAMEGWEWESIFASSLLEQDTSIISWQDDFCEPEPTVAAAPAVMAHISGHPSSFPSAHFPDTIASPESLLKSKNGGASIRTPIPTSAMNAANTSNGSLESSDYNNDTAVTSHHLPSEASPNNPPTVISSKKKKKKRDPRLECPNFLAGRVPCSCPEEDEHVEVEDVVKKRPKVGARCQVPSCGGDISHLKGYHQRHRVCLGCANSTKVILKDQPHRYCQQCGKFHRLSDFDEGKRSCRRKLERHNKRRRRRPLEEQEGQDSGSGVPVPGVENDHNNVHSSIHAAATQEEWNTAAATQEEWNTAASTKQSSGTCPPRTHHKKEVGGSTQDLVNPIIDDLRASDDSSASVLRFEQEFISSNQNELDELSWLTMLMDDATEEADIATRNGKQLHASKPELSRASYLSTSQKKHTEYVSPCPTGRISFKLYDWNPADFPRRLRQQIFKWLANMPVELESYIRSGCIILTFFIAMPQVMWDKILDDWIGQVQKLVLQPGTELWGTGQIVVRMNEKRVHVRNGKVTSADQKELLAPFLVDLYPLSLEAGCHTHIYVSGFNFSGARFLVSFGEHYLECSDCKPVDCHHFTHGTVWKSIDNLEIQKVTVFLPDSQKFGPAYVEVVSDHGVSNFLPMLVADKDVCAEINAVRVSSVASASVNYNANTRHGKAEILRDQCGMDILTDLGWALRYMNEPRFVDKAEVREAFIKRLRGLLIFSLEHNCHVLAKQLVHAALTMGVIQNMGFLSAGSEGQHVWNMMETLRDVKDIPISKGLPSLDPKVEQCSSLSPTIARIREADNSYGIDSLSQLKGLQGPKSAVSKLKQLCLALISSQSKECDNVVSAPAKDWTVMEVPLLEERVPILEDGLRQKDTCWARPLGWSRKPTRSLGSSTLCGSNRRLCRIVVTAVSVVTICTGMCFMLQHPHEVAEISMSLRRCLWGSTQN